MCIYVYIVLILQMGNYRIEAELLVGPDLCAPVTFPYKEIRKKRMEFE